jgi:branched-chain amino acid transport system permease protein
MLDVLVYGVLSGATFAMVAFGFSLVLGVLGIVNMVHGVFVVLGGFATHWLSSRGWPLPAAVLGATLFTGVAGVLTQKLFIDRVFKTNPLMVLVQTFGLSIVLVQVMEKTWGASERLLRVDVPGYPMVEMGQVIVPTIEVIIFAIALASTLMLVLLLNGTNFGRALRACRDNPRNAAILGINVGNVYMGTMLVCALWTGLAGALVIGTKPLAPYMHLQWTVDAFLIVIIGGLSSVPGVLVAGFLYGALNYMAFYYASTWAPALIYGTLIALLLWRPQGLFGLGAVVRK